MKKTFQINDLIILKLEDGETNIYIAGEKFIQCKYLLIEESTITEDDSNNFDSIDKFAYNYENKDA
ncbi:hypothetical protein LCGC14_1837640, partial [marine sediment metagenome]